MQLHYSQSSRENAIQSSDNSRLPDYWEVQLSPSPFGGVEFAEKYSKFLLKITSEGNQPAKANRGLKRIF